jgi:polyhydroxyalkanoate synthase
VRYLVGEGFTVFAMSWRNPGPTDRDLGMDDYLEHGLMAAIGAVEAIVPRRRVHAVGYCLGGTLLAIGAGALVRESDHRLASVTLFAAQTDFTEPGELGMFVDDSQLSFLEDMMWAHGYLDSGQMAGAFQLLRTNDLIWSRNMRQYVVGEDQPLNDLMAWNADTTRMPYRMHSEYLRRLFLRNDLAEGRYLVRGRPVALGDITAPMFVVGTTLDHVAPWRSVHRIHLLTDGDLTFALTNGGHNAGIVSEPGKANRAFKILRRPQHGKYVDPDTYLQVAPLRQGSWWTAWTEWLGGHSGHPVAPPAMGAAHAGFLELGPAPGTYVMQK